MKKIKALIMDVDGTLTDGKIYMGQNGEVFKAFDIHDGLAIHELLPLHEVTPVIITGRSSAIVDNRARELGVKHVYQGVGNKPEKIEELCKTLNCSKNEMAYIGDDLADLDAMKMCEVRGCPRNAVAEICDICEFVSEKNSGEGAVRDFVEWLIVNSYV
ncbi:MAG: HAD-IIIA family hydrolase [Lachnospiraceae bacterium]|nr:HAD-IIIA family hydrolase [Lachnospiraceae bacterium]